MNTMSNLCSQNNEPRSEEFSIPIQYTGGLGLEFHTDRLF